jgi:hypothetical protein
MAGERKSAAEAHGFLQEVVDFLGLNDDEASDFIGSGMKRAGYKPRIEWGEPEGDGGSEGDYFSRRRQQSDRQPQRRVGGGGGGYTG